MIKLTFMIQAGINPELINIIIKGKQVIYSDRIWSMGVILLPPNKEMENKILMSRNKYPQHLLNMFKLSDNDLKEYESAKSEEDLAQFAIKDCNLKGYKLVRRTDEPS
jgi:hypothetical protein